METTLGHRIRELRETAGMTLRELAREVGVSAAFLSDIEHGKRYPSTDVLIRIAGRLKTDVKALRDFDSRPPLDDLKRKSYANPAYGFALRRMVRENVTSEELTSMLDQLIDKRRSR
jgi:transcriptional regulator with XRE-family HTH domain